MEESAGTLAGSATKS
jgi:hypothetical protein